ncbi:SMC-Scp complex subunit ScpB [Streptococcus sp. DD13]|uniref:SMC-Scp complex subunit ScpB n=1 Tax=Streptococcus sp. DD13 TaxID=1777881 RepID=UPI00079A947E|nr:SMC-Scp complex subunit ScpB [Streptococcus sp. DD13]KXT78232.1 Segregation and condensation protein B [Streptococcus sp. DD13]
MSRLAKLETLLFVAGEEGVTARVIVEILEIQPRAVQQQMDQLAQKYLNDEDSGLALLESSNTYKLVSKKKYAPILRSYARTPMNQTMSRAMLECLSIIAYKQPITRVEVDDIRGVNSSGTISKLQAFDLIRENGKKEVLGRPNLYVTTDYFLDYMGINSLDELPDISDIDLDEQETALFVEREYQEDEN